MTLPWIAERPRMGTSAHLAYLLYWRGKKRRRTKNALYFKILILLKNPL